ncbi:MAG: hypothetical protein HC797_06755 [Anaerolineales bacterium]|nr:hypothetical protein [Anaerolineales bacterium]
MRTRCRKSRRDRVTKKYHGVVAVGLGSVKAKFSGEVDILELDEPNRAKIKAHGKATGSTADAISEMILSDAADNTTLVQWTADINVSGQLASLVSSSDGACFTEAGGGVL